MGFTLNVTGAESISLGVASIKTVEIKAAIPIGSTARSTDLSSSMCITGSISDSSSGDDTMKIAKWSMVPAEKSDCYRQAVVEYVSAGEVVRKVTYPNAYVVDYNEDFANAQGTGTFKLVISQKKDKIPDVKIEGGYKE